MPAWKNLIAFVTLAASPWAGLAQGAFVTGTATYRERILLPAGAVFEATLEDVSRADAPSELIGRARLDPPGAPPFSFSIAYDPQRIQPRQRYVVRARITHEGALLFTTDTVHAVLWPDGRTHVDLLMRRVGGGTASAVADSAASGPSTSRPASTPAEPARRMRGTYTYLADAGLFTDCRSGQRLPVAPAGDNAALESAYLKVRTQPGSPVLVVVDARAELRPPMEGAARPMLVVERFVSAQPGACEAAGHASLENTYWKLVQLRDAAVEAVGRQREPHLILQPALQRVAGSGGCNRIVGSYTLDREQLKFGRMAGTMMACREGMAQERAFLDALDAVARWRVEGERLELLDADGAVVARFDSVYLR